MGRPRRGKGKRGGLRVVYLYIEEISAVVLFAVYDKDDAADLTPDQKRNVSAAAESARRELIAAFRGDTGREDRTDGND